MQAISVRQPEAWLIAKGYKNVENRTIRTHKRGRVAIHASSRRMTRDDWQWLRDLCAYNNRPVPAENEIGYGGVIGTVEITDCVTDHPSPWFEGPYGYVLANPIEFVPEDFLPWKGKLGWFDVPIEMSEEGDE